MDKRVAYGCALVLILLVLAVSMVPAFAQPATCLAHLKMEGALRDKDRIIVDIVVRDTKVVLRHVRVQETELEAKDGEKAKQIAKRLVDGIKRCEK